MGTIVGECPAEKLACTRCITGRHGNDGQVGTARGRALQRGGVGLEGFGGSAWKAQVETSRRAGACCVRIARAQTGRLLKLLERLFGQAGAVKGLAALHVARESSGGGGGRINGLARGERVGRQVLEGGCHGGAAQDNPGHEF
ncbi:MAG: hypothetical protein KA795_11205 [Burkholderiaceae bacterium]|nr:hypothetical protein [Burkholderiaceae bacterium]